MMNKIDHGHRPGVGLFYSVFKKYLRFTHHKIYYRKVHAIGMENIPADGTPLLIVSNHQNCLNDALGILFCINDRKPHFITRGDVFALSPIFAKFLYSIGLLPSFRLRTEGEESLGKNKDIFRVSEQSLLDGDTVVMFPEAGHQNKRWLGTFTYGYTKLAFEAAELNDFEKDILILPSCNHYSDYFGLRNDLMIRFGTPISLKPYYELYKTKPRTAQREVNKLVREQISSLMLNIRDLEHYEQIDFLRNTYGKTYARTLGLNPEVLPEKLEADKKLTKHLEGADEKIFQDTELLMRGLKYLKIRDRHLENRPRLPLTALKCIGMLALLPIWIASLYPALPIYGIGLAVSKVSKDRMFEGTFMFAVSALFTIPIFTVAGFIAAGCLVNRWFATTYAALFPLMAVFAWNYAKWGRHLLQDIRFLCKSRKAELVGLRNLRKNLHESLDRISK